MNEMENFIVLVIACVIIAIWYHGKRRSEREYLDLEQYYKNKYRVRK